MSTLELPASIALIIVMAILALCLAADARAHQPSRAVASMTGITNCEMSNGAFLLALRERAVEKLEPILAPEELA